MIRSLITWEMGFLCFPLRLGSNSELNGLDLGRLMVMDFQS